MKKKDLFPLLLVILVGVIIWFFPHSKDVSDRAWHLLSIFVATIIGIILKPLPMGAMAILSMTASVATYTLSLQEVLDSFHNQIAWLVVFAFFISRGIIKTGLGSRLSYYFISLIGKRTLSLGYGLLVSDLVLAPAIPSVTARTGGIVFPIAKGLAQSFGSDPLLGTERLIGSFLMKVAYQGSVITSAMFLTAMASNPLLACLTEKAGYCISWGQWALCALLPGIVSLIIMPLIVYKIYPPSIKKTEHAAEFASNKLKELGRLKRGEIFMLIIFISLIFLWILGSFVNINATVVALIGVAAILFFKVLNWSDFVEESAAWDTFIWFATLVMMATQLNSLGFTPWFSHQVINLVQGMYWLYAFAILVLIYFYAHYFFASNAAHVGAMYPAFFLVALGLGTPPVIAILVFAYASNLMGGLTHYGSGPAPIYYGSGYIDVKDWWRVGFILSVANLIIWMGLGSLWWKLLGYF